MTSFTITENPSQAQVILHFASPQNPEFRTDNEFDYLSAYQQLLNIFRANIVPNQPSPNDLHKKLSMWAESVIDTARLNPANENEVPRLFHERVSELRKILVNFDGSPLKKPIQLPGGDCVSQWIWKDWTRLNQSGSSLFARSPLDESSLPAHPTRHDFADNMVNWLNQVTNFFHTHQQSRTSSTGDGECKDGQLVSAQTPPFDRLDKDYMKSLAKISPEKDDERRMRYQLVIEKIKNENLVQLLGEIDQELVDLRSDYVQTVNAYDAASRASDERMRQTLADFALSQQELVAGLHTRMENQDASHRESEAGLRAQIDAQNQAHIDSNRLHDQQIADTRQATAEARAASERQNQEIRRAFENEAQRLDAELRQTRNECQTAVETARMTQEVNARLGVQMEQTNVELQAVTVELAEARTENAANSAQLNTLHQKLAAEQRRVQELAWQAQNSKKRSCVLQ